MAPPQALTRGCLAGFDDGIVAPIHMGSLFADTGAFTWAAGLFWLATLVYCIARDREERHIWIYVIVFLNVVGALIYMGVRLIPLSGLWDKIGAGARRRREIERTEAEIVHLGEKPHLLARLALLKLDAGDLAEPERLLRTALTKADDAEYRFDLARVLHRKGDLEGALALLREVVAKDRNFNYGDGLRLLARCTFDLGRIDEADPLYEELVRTRPSAETRYHRAVLLERKGDAAAAAAELDRLRIESGATPPFARRAQKQWIQQAAAMRRRLG